MRLVVRLSLAAAAVLAAVAARTEAQATVQGGVYDSLTTRAALQDAQVTILELGRFAATDARGRFRFDSVPAGRYTITFMHPLLDSLDISAPEVPIVVPATGTIFQFLATPSPATTYSRLCITPVESRTGAIFGRVRSAVDSSPVVGARVFGSWVDMILVGTRLRREHREVGVVSGKRGEFLLCGIPNDIAVDVRATRGMLAAGPVPMQVGELLISHQDFTVPLADTGARMLSGDSGRALRPNLNAPPGGASIAGTVRTADGKPVADALVGVLGFDANARTGPAGQFLISRVPSGTRTLQLRAVGTAPRNITVDVPEGRRRDVTVVLDRRIQQLATVAVQTEGGPRDIPHSSTGFSARKKAGLGRYLTGDDIKLRAAATVIDVLAMAGGVSRDWSSAGPTVTIRGSTGRCTPSVFLDGMSISTGERGSIAELEGLVQPAAITGVEVYPGPFIPGQFDRSAQTGCGTIAIWTRR